MGTRDRGGPHQGETQPPRPCAGYTRSEHPYAGSSPDTILGSKVYPPPMMGDLNKTPEGEEARNGYKWL